VAQRVGRGIALPLHDRGTGRVVSGQQHAPAALYPRERPGTNCTPRCPEGYRKLRFPDFVTTQGGGKVVSLAHRPPLPPGNAPGTYFCYRLCRHQGHSAIGRILSMKNSSDTIWDLTSDLPICSETT